MTLAIEIENSKNLKTPLAYVAAACNKSTPIEKCVLVRASENGVFLTGVDSKTHQLTLKVPDSTTGAEGSCILDASHLNRVVKNLRDEPVQFGIDDNANQLVMQSRSRMKLDLFNEPSENYPLESELPPVVCTISAEKMHEVFKKALQLCDKEEFVSLVGRGQYIYVYTKNGGRMFSKTALRCDTENTEEWEIAIQMNLLAKFPPFWTGEAKVHLNEGRDTLAISLGDEHLIIRQLLTDTISYTVDGIIDQHTGDYISIKTGQFIADLDNADFIMDKRGLLLTLEGETLYARCQGASRGEMDSPIRPNEFEGTVPDVRVDPKLLQRAIRALEAVDMVIEYVEDRVPSVMEDQEDILDFNLRLVDADAPDYRTVIVTTLKV